MRETASLFRNRDDHRSSFPQLRMERHTVGIPIQDLNAPVRIGHSDGSTGKPEYFFYPLLCHTHSIVFHGKIDILFIGFRADFQDTFFFRILKPVNNGVLNQRLKKQFWDLLAQQFLRNIEIHLNLVLIPDLHDFNIAFQPVNIIS